ncbi:UDP-N-acetylmuramoyl-L-alanyl-D-glutamate--2,6-diaminopimelate ligase [Veillonella atypica]|uniref:UDP-N-acetylmuramoyl-L-alanyl-D-glutamate--2,6-diaminopimelate ligase n=1 Tax=Veillonella atypica TaxID=39777 RepID=A0A133S348_9FIRM|nr:UDP-N-acetylmuramoyl-L-alanyl-D-glutamate--2,6-diaminopimelate ligase [Veillonella atypica]KXA62857.1 UDP-N-acetylmuramoyl-L-alanyl-D-glutamate--2,6-diaminopimelate ligase [Veillonella atypica]
MKTLKDIISTLDVQQVQGDQNVSIQDITADSRAVKLNSLFIALDGATVDGHNYIDKAVAAGAVAVIVSKPVTVPDDVCVITVSDTRQAMMVCVPYFFDYPANRMRMVGVTGTNGKTTTTHMIRHILKAQGHKVGVIGTVHIMIGDTSYPIHNTTPDVVDLQHILHQMVQENVEYCVMEVSSHALALGRVSGVEFDTAVFTNLTQDHLDFHKTFENYLAAKCKLFEQVSASNQVKDNKGAVINIDDSYGHRVMEKTTAPTITYSTLGKGTLNASDVHMSTKNSQYTVNYKGESYPVSMNTTGLFNVYNTLAAIGACLQEGISMEAIDTALKTFSSVPGRFELIEEGQDFAVVVDYAHTPDGLQNILETAKAIKENRIIIVFGCGGDRDATKRPIMGRIAAEYGDKIYVTSDNPRTEDPVQIVKDVEVGVKEALRDGTSYEVIVNRREAINHAIHDAKAGDIVIIAGKGHENYQILKNETIHFDDREEARKALKEI